MYLGYAKSKFQLFIRVFSLLVYMQVISVTMKLEAEVITVRIPINISTVNKNNSKVGGKMYQKAWNMDAQKCNSIIMPYYCYWTLKTFWLTGLDLCVQSEL